MKALLLKDWFVIWKQCRIMLLVPLLLILVSGIMPGNEGHFFRILAVMLLAMFPITVMGLDERNKWEIYAATMPYSKRDMVLSKYVLSMMGVLIGCVLSALVGMSMAPYSFSPVMISASFVCGCLYVSFIMPIIFRFGVEKGRLWFILIVVALSAGLGGASSILSTDNSAALAVMPLSNASVILLPIIGLILLALSAILSISIYNKREF